MRPLSRRSPSRAIRALLPLLMLAGLSIPAAAQLSASASVVLSVVVLPKMQIRELAPERVLFESATSRESVSAIEVEGNLAHHVRVRLSSRLGAAVESARILVKNVRGQFQRLDSGTWVTVASGTRGRSRHEVACRIEGTDPAVLASASCDLEYEVEGGWGEGRMVLFAMTAPGGSTSSND